MRVVVGYEKFGRVRDACIAAGHEAVSIDTEPTQASGPHMTGDFWEQLALYVKAHDWPDVLFAFPVCTYVCGSGWHRNKNDSERQAKSEYWIDNFRSLLLLRARIPVIVIENSVGVLSRIEKPSQIIQPYQYGADASKATCLWIYGAKSLPVDPALYIPPRLVCRTCTWHNSWGTSKCGMCRSEDLLPRWSNQTDSGQNKLGPSKDRAAERGTTYPGIATALAKLVPLTA